MPVKIKRRRVRKRRRSGEISKMKFAAFIVIMLLAVLLGYLTARFVIGPLLGYDADESPIQLTNQDDKSGENTGGENKKQDETAENGGEDETADSAAIDEGYALQFGVFSTKEAAQKLADSLTEKGIEAKVVEDSDMFKVISPVIKTKDEAIEKLDEIKDKEVEDVFIASF